MREVPGCTKVTLEVEMAVAIKQLELHHSQVQSLARKPDKPKHPELTMAGYAMEDTDFDRFLFMFEQYKQLAGIATNAGSNASPRRSITSCMTRTGAPSPTSRRPSSLPTSGGLWLNLSRGQPHAMESCESPKPHKDRKN